jgi:tetratricopeptide (TPR) repeat protein
MRARAAALLRNTRTTDARRRSGTPCSLAARGAAAGACALLTIAACALQAQPRARQALVIGNSKYTTVAPLKNPYNDARDLAALLESFGFRVTRIFDATGEQLDRSIAAFAGGLAGADSALLFYAGHGVQVAGENYMIGVDFAGADEAALKYRGYSLERARELVAKSGVRLSVLVFDACRNNPLASKSRLIYFGLAPMEAGLGTLIAYSAGPGQVAADSPDKPNGLFTGELLKGLREPGDLLSVFRRVRESVYSASGGKQRPWIHEDLLRDAYFVAARPPQAPAPSPPPSRTPQEDPLARGLALFHQGNYDEALKLFELARRTEPENPFAHNAAGAAYSQLGLNRPAVDSFGRAIALKPDYAAAYYNRARAYLREAQYELAIGDFTWAIEQEPENPIHYSPRGRAFFQRRRYEEALADYTRAIELNPFDRTAFLGRAEVHERQGRKREAEADRREAARLGGQ